MRLAPYRKSVWWQAMPDTLNATPHRCGFVASDLGNWERWDFAAAFAKALRAGKDQVFASRYSIVFYLIRNPRPEAKALLEALKVEKLL